MTLRGRTHLGELSDPHSRLKFGLFDVDVLGLRAGVVGELDLDGHHVGVGAEGLPAETVFDRETLACYAVQELVHLH